jgi:hypothetical protein
MKVVKLKSPLEAMGSSEPVRTTSAQDGEFGPFPLAF